MTCKNIIFISVFMLFSAWSAASNQTQTIDTVVAIVNDHVILQSEIDDRMNHIIEGLKANNPSDLPPRSIIYTQVLDRMIVEEIQIQMATQAGIRVSDEQVNRAIDKIARANQLSLEQFHQSFPNAKEFQAFHQQIEREMIIGELQQKQVGKRIHISEQDIQNFLNSAVAHQVISSEYRIGHILIPLPESPDNRTIKEAETLSQKVYEEIRKGNDFQQVALTFSRDQYALEGGDLGWRQGNQLPTIFEGKVNTMQVGDISQPFRSASGFHIIKLIDKKGGTEKVVNQTQVQHILIKPNEIRSQQACYELAKEIYQKIEKGEDFKELAKIYSDDPGSASKGGDLGWVSPNQMVPEFEKVMNHTAVSQVSPPFQSPFGWHLLKVIEKRHQDLSLSLRQEQAQQFIFKKKFDEELNLWLREIKGDSFIEIKKR
jgi:peptidyl-prolyl cis-trans isomerase SurA